MKRIIAILIFALVIAWLGSHAVSAMVQIQTNHLKQLEIIE